MRNPTLRKRATLVVGEKNCKSHKKQRDLEEMFSEKKKKIREDDPNFGKDDLLCL